MPRFRGFRRAVVLLATESVHEWSADNVPRLSAALAFYTVMSLAPLLILTMSVAAVVFGAQAAEGQIAWQIRHLVGRAGAEAVQSVLQNAHRPAAGFIAAVLSVFTLALAASSVFAELRDGLNSIWHVSQGSSTTGLASILSMVRERSFAFALVLSTGLLLLTMLVWSAAMGAVGDLVTARFAVPDEMLSAWTFLLSMLVVAILFGLLYWLLPETPVKWSDVIVGALVTSFLFEIGKQLVAAYLGRATTTSAYGAAGSLIVVTGWVYYCAQLFYLGAEMTKVYAKRFGSRKESHNHSISEQTSPAMPV